MRLRLLLAFAFAFAFAFALPAEAQRESPPSNAATAQTETIGAPANGDGYCVATNNAAAITLTPPARFTAARLSRVRFVGLTFLAGATSTRLCHAFGETAPLAASACVTPGSNSGIVLTSGQTSTYAIARDPTNGGLVTISAQANAGTDGFICVSFGW